MPAKTAKTPSLWDAFMTKFRDIVFIILFLGTTTGWIVTSTSKKNDLKNKVEVLTNKLEDNTKQLEKINEILLQQSQLNGRIIEYMQHQ